MKKIKIICWKFGLFGNDGNESGVECLFNELNEIISNYRKDKKYIQYDYAKLISIIIYDYNNVKEYINWDKKISNYYSKTINNNFFPIFIGGNHLSVLPIYNHYGKKERKTLILTFDAHIDLYGEIDNDLYHGNFLHHVDKNDNVDIIHIGNRELLVDKNEVSNVLNETFSMFYIIKNGIDKLVKIINDKSSEYDDIHLDFDVDVFDQSKIDATGFPIPFGLEPNHLIKILSSIENLFLSIRQGRTIFVFQIL